MNQQFAIALGQQLRRVRRAKGWSLDVAAARSRGAWKAGTIGTYERGERALTASGLADLAALYDVSVVELLPGHVVRRSDLLGVYLDIDLHLLATITDGRLAPLSRYAAAVEAQRSDGVLRVDPGGLRLLAELCDTSLEDLVIEFVTIGVVPVDPCAEFGIELPRNAIRHDVLS